MQSRIDYVEKHGDIDFTKENYQELEYITDGYIDTKIGKIPKITSNIKPKDKFRNMSILFGLGRDNYMIKPGIYAIGEPKTTSPVIVSCNYKYTFDILRSDLEEMDCWLLIINTFGVNVWCAAGKGTFGTDEVVRRVEKTKIKELIAHSVLILPQLSAPGVDSHMVRKMCGMRIIFGPVDSSNLKDFIKNRYRATEEMRKVRFDLKDRVKLTPLQLIQNMKYYLLALIAMVLMNLVNGGVLGDSLKRGLHQSIPFLICVFVGAVIFPIILPIIPSRAFSLKGAILGIITTIPIALNSEIFLIDRGGLWLAVYCLMCILILVNVCLHFTGSTTYTSFSGVVKETLVTIPVSIVGAIIGISVLFLLY